MKTPTMPGRGRAIGLGLCGLCSLLAGCPPQPQPAEWIPFHEAVYRVNANNARIDKAILGQGVSASGKFVDDEGRTHSYLLGGSILLLKPRYLYMNLQHGLGETVIRAGSNAQRYWLWIKPRIDTLWWGKYEHLDKADPEAMPLRPDQLIEALGIDELPEDTAGPEGPIYRVVPDYDQLLFIRYTPTNQGYIAKEYWLDRRRPYLIRRIVFRDTQGRVQMRSELSGHAPVAPSGPLVAKRIVIEWPQDEGVMRLSIGRWKWRQDVGPDSAAFAFPHAKAAKQVQVDRRYDLPQASGQVWLQ